MHQVVAQDDASAGRNISLTEDIISHLTWIGKTVGPLLDAARKNENLIALEKVKAFHAENGIFLSNSLPQVGLLPSVRENP